jgi:O-antigen/teichoic acid export membrane protein
MADEERLLVALDDTASTGVRVAGLRLTTYAVGLGASVVIARALGPTGRGLYALPIAFLGIVTAFVHVGLEHANVFLASQGVILKRLWSVSAAIAAMAAAVAWTTVVVLRWVVGPSFLSGLPVSWIVVSVVQVPFLLMTLYWMGLLQLDGRLRSAVRAVLVATTIHAAATLLLAAFDAITPFRVLLLAGLVNGLSWAFMLWLGVSAGLASRWIGSGLVRRALTFGLQAQLAIVFTFLLLRVDQILVQRQLGFTALGLYSLAAVLSEMLWLAADSFAASLLPHQVRAGGGDERRLGFAGARLSVLVAVVGGAAAWVLAPFAIEIVYGEGFSDAVGLFRLLLPGVVALAMARPLTAIVVKEGRILLAAAINAVALAVNVGLNLLLLPAIGVEGASVASSVTYIGMALAYVVVVRREGVAGWSDLLPGRRDVVRLATAFGRSRPR